MTPEEFKKIRLKAGLSQRDLGLIFNVSHGTISNMEKGYIVIPENISNGIKTNVWETYKSEVLRDIKYIDKMIKESK